MSTAVRTSGVTVLCAYLQIESLSEDSEICHGFYQFQACSQTMSTVGAYMYICVYAYIIIYIYIMIIIIIIIIYSVHQAINRGI
jgi:hypothetical protein